MNNKNIIRKYAIIPFIFSCLTCIACSQPLVSGYTTDPSKKEEKIPTHPVRVEVQITTSFGEPIHHIKVKAKTREGSESNRTNHMGRTRFNLERTGTEPIIIEFKLKEKVYKKTIRHLPTKLSEVGLHFEMISPSNIKFINYNVHGLHR